MASAPAPDPEPHSAPDEVDARPGIRARLGREWADAGWGARSVFVIAAIYWLLTVGLVVITLPRVRSAYELGLVLSFYLVPLLYAVILRAAYVWVRRPPRPPLVSWWLLVLGALLGILVGVARSTVPAT